ncbi:MAG TPA: LuxR C-terminal-related transcriptional regulator [Solirubrobacteraceae bacterium]|nr:LuxR C-terminal-related transcriptional regulator [Solirubrobacteraceae bacterium]
MTPDAAATLPSAPRLTVLPALRHGAASLKGLVARDRLVRRLMDVHDVPLALLLAPAGYGKTTTLLEWAQHDDRPFAWVALHHADDDAKHLRNSVARATDPLIARGGEFVIVLDDVQVLRSREAIAVLTALVEEPPPGARLVLASRCEPPLPLGRLRAHREVLELTTRDFVMTRSEAAALLELAGADLAAADVDTLVRRTEGWPAGLYLAAVSLREQPDAATAIARFGGDDRVVSDYVADSLLSELMAEEVAFLRRTSVLDRLSGPLCDAVLDDAGSARTLRDLARANGLVVPLDRTDEWYRYHGLLAQTLRAELRRHEPKLERELHRRASRWYADHDDVDAAIRHAAAAEDVRLAGDLLWANAFRYIPQGHNATVRRWLGHFTDEQVAGSVPLALVAANAHLADGSRDHAEHWTAAAARALDGLPARRREPALRAGIAVMRAAIARDGVQRMRDDAARAYALEADDSPRRSLDRLLEGTACHLLGARDRASALLQEGSRRGVVGAPSVNALCLAQLALLALDDDDWARATELATRARSQIERFRLAGYPTMSLVLAVASLTQAQRGRVQAATDDGAEASRLLDAMDDFVPWYVAEVRIVLARAALRLSDVVGARAHIEGAALAVRSTPDAPVLEAWLEAASSQVESYSTSAIVAPATLTAAELRILALLPTHLSFREMGSRLYVSPNTVKTQAQAVYRKLDASSRSEAVTRARALGLLEL